MELIVRKPDTGYLDSVLWVPKTAINVEGTKSALTFQFFDQQKVFVLTLYKESEHHLLVPREFWDPKDFSFPVVDARPHHYERADIRSRIKLDHREKGGVLQPTGETVQQDALRSLLYARGGVLQLACGKGKTVVALELIAQRAVPALIIVDTTQLLKQWRDEIDRCLDVPDGVGLIQGDSMDWRKPIVLATYHTLAARAAALPEEVRRWFGTIVWDEAHHVGAPVFCRSADLFYGKRIGLTATPDRDDGMHVIYNFHLGPVVFKNLIQDRKPRIYFMWTGFGIDKTDPKVLQAVNDKNGELHIGKVAVYLGACRQRVDYIVNVVRQAVAANRKVIVLSKSVDALINMLAAWNNPNQPLISDIPFPTAADVGETVPPLEIDVRSMRKVYKKIGSLNAAIKKVPANLQTLLQEKQQLELALDGHRVYKKCESLWNKKRADYLKSLLAQPSTGGLMIYKVDPDTRTAMLRSQAVTFAIAKYGREGLDERSLDTIIVNEPLSSRNSLQQLLGRVLREKEGKKESIAVFLEDDVGPFIGMCKKLRGHLTSWPHDEGGPFDYENIGHRTAPRSLPEWTSTASATSTSRARGS